MVVDSAVGTTAAAVAVVAADKQPSQRAASSGEQKVVTETATPSLAGPTPPAAFADGTQPAPKVIAEGTAPEAPAYRCPPELASRAHSLGEAWAQEYVRELRAQSRDIVGGWPGTLREARRRVLAHLRNIDPLLLDELARITNLAARRGWESVSEPDLEP